MQVQVKTKPSLTAMKAERNDFSLPVHIWVAFESVNIYHIYSVYPDQKSWWTGVTLLYQMQMQYRTSMVDKMKIEPVMILFVDNTTSSNMADQNDDFITKESCKVFSVFWNF